MNIHVESLERRPTEWNIRRPNLKPSVNEEPLYYFFNDPTISMILSAFSGSIPEMERQFIHSMRQYQDFIQDPQLQKDVRAFIGQEAHHSNEHKTINNYFEQAGLDMKTIDQHMKKVMNRWKLNLSAKQQLAHTVCLEHFTGLMADFGLRKRPDVVNQASNETMLSLWTWHLIEEAEHKSVAYDLYLETVDEPIRLRLTMLYITTFMLAFNGWHTTRLLIQINEHRNMKSLWNGAKFLFGKKGMVTSMFKDYLDFYRLDFHPWDHDNRKELEEWKTRFIGNKY
ncbi:metal-dependent hydrolase [Acinetobacter pragensis]|uniref:metal-dependent hydrolase n=1 Tax=Acinetobacter pragensis TaxID=1806892 RepID=UPI003340CFAD